MLTSRVVEEVQLCIEVGRVLPAFPSSSPLCPRRTFPPVVIMVAHEGVESSEVKPTRAEFH